MLDRYLRKTFSVKRNCPTVGVRFEADTNEHILYVTRMPPARIMNRISLLLGDTLHNLRAALDYMTWQFVQQYTHGNVKHPERVHFPIAYSPKHFENMKQQRGYLWEIDPAIHATFERFQPHRGGEIPLRLQHLRDLSNSDKHRLLTPVVIPQHVPGEAGIALGSELLLPEPLFKRVLKTTMRNPEIVELGTELASIHVTGRIFKRNMKVYYHFTPRITLAERRPVVEVLDNLAAAVVTVIKTFEKEYFKSFAPLEIALRHERSPQRPPQPIRRTTFGGRPTRLRIRPSRL